MRTVSEQDVNKAERRFFFSFAEFPIARYGDEGVENPP